MIGTSGPSPLTGLNRTMAEVALIELLLASASPARRKLLEAAGVPFRVVPANVDEAALKRALAADGSAQAPAAIAEALAAAKARTASAAHRASLVIGADQVLALGDEPFDKPGDLVTARAQLRRLRGKAHRLFSAVALAQEEKVVWSIVDHATLTMRDFSDGFLDAYLAEAGPRLCQIVGCYEIEARGVQLFQHVEGDHFTIVGLPLMPLLAELRTRGVIGT
jgi:septum formation protein